MTKTKTNPSRSKDAQPAGPQQTRREVLSWGVAVGAGGGALGVLTMLVARMPMPALLPERTKKFKIGTASELPPGTAVFFEPEQTYVIADKLGIYAISALCTHLGCVVQRQRAGFICPCHGSRFNTRGKVVQGPAPRALDWYHVGRLPGGRLFVDRSRVVKPGTKLKV